MLEAPKVNRAALEALLAREYRVASPHVAFLRVGGDVDSAAYEVSTGGGERYYLKLRHGAFAAATIAISEALRAAGNTHVIAAVPGQSGQLTHRLDSYTVALYPFVEGENVFRRPLTRGQWRDLGGFVAALHALDLPAGVLASLPVETFADDYRRGAESFLAAAVSTRYDEHVAARLAAMLRDHAPEFRELISRADRLSKLLARREQQLVPCHADLHAGNVLVAGEEFYVVDWDTAILAPKERDLMFIGAGIGGAWNRPEEAERFLQGYGDAPVDRDTIAYYRCQRVIEDVVAFSRELLLTTAGGADRERSLQKFSAQFAPGDVLDIALAT